MIYPSIIQVTYIIQLFQDSTLRKSRYPKVFCGRDVLKNWLIFVPSFNFSYDKVSVNVSRSPSSHETSFG